MVKEFEGKTEQEAIAKAIDELHIEREDFDVEVVENTRGGLFKKSSVKIRIHFDDDNTAPLPDDITPMGKVAKRVLPATDEDGPDLEQSPNPDLENSIVEFVTGILEKMGYPATVNVAYRKERKLGLNIDSEYSSIIIGRKGKNLDAIQLVANVFAGKTDNDLKVIVDSENYRTRHEEQLIRMALKSADQVKRSGRSVLLEPMNPFERRLVHTALNDYGVDTKSEGDGLYKQIRITLKQN
jgi:spoIIIJ-associated protein